jgi:DNA-binding NtrC family response regulator
MAYLKDNNSMIRILIVEDDEEMRSLLQDFIEEEGYKADFAQNGFIALSKVAQEPFDLVITDIRMPGLTGLDIIPGIKKLQPAAYIVAITAFGSEEVYRRSIAKGASAYLEKPLRFNELRALVHEAVSSKKDKRGDERSEGVTSGQPSIERKGGG